VNFRVIIAATALARIDEQARFIAVEAQAPLNAARWLGRVFAAVTTLETLPRRCPKAPEDGHHPFEIRALDVDGFLLIFTVHDTERTVYVLNARHSRQLPQPDVVSPPWTEKGSGFSGV
jgi:plasmid stabilization system protein ParE